MQNSKGIDTNKAEGLCMVLGCPKIALYRNWSKTRGYCRKHKHFATPKENSWASQQEPSIRKLEDS